MLFWKISWPLPHPNMLAASRRPGLITTRDASKRMQRSHPKLGSYRFRIGDYRVIFDLEKEDMVILRIGNRLEIYGR
jgi:mRNA-degrading endonuclease RelE of RelBE toxin-antitoxin system